MSADLAGRARVLQFAAVGLTALGMPLAGATLDNRPVTFAKDIAPIFQAKCEECHRAGTAAPMALTKYEEVRPWAKSIRERVLTRNMPPWHLDKTVGIQQFQNDRSLSDGEIATIVRWIDAGAPLGDPKDLPAPRVWPKNEEWQLAKKYGQPDLIIQSEPYTMPAQGQDVWWKPASAVPVTEPRWVRAVEMRPGSVDGRKITHHAIAYLEQDEPDVGIIDDGHGDPADGRGTLMEWAIGKQYDDFRPDTGKLLLPGARIRWDIHLHAAGEPIRDHVELAVYLFPKGEKPKHRTYLTGFEASNIPDSNSELDIPPNSLVETQGFHVLRQPSRLENFQPHMHLRGKAMSLEAILPDGTTRMINFVNNFNFNWMNNYIYTDESAPVLPKGTVIHVTAYFDNTTANRFNPDPKQWVGFGDRTVDEMGFAWVNVTTLTDQDYKEWVEKHKTK